jgi:hypothetical protein
MYKSKKQREQEQEQTDWMPILKAAELISGVLQGKSNQAIKELKNAVDDGNVKIKRKAPGGKIQTSPDSYWEECWARLRRQINSIGRSNAGIFENAERKIDQYCDYPTFVSREDVKREWGVACSGTRKRPQPARTQQLTPQLQVTNDAMVRAFGTPFPPDINSKNKRKKIIDELKSSGHSLPTDGTLAQRIRRILGRP